MTVLRTAAQQPAATQQRVTSQSKKLDDIYRRGQQNAETNDNAREFGTARKARRKGQGQTVFLRGSVTMVHITASRRLAMQEEETTN